ncbi:hypothetical protein ACFR9U_07340 [Halorientalis brevis]|uniref:DUF7312 domain-containing protein n=1 Tax=Halorientalis brevis TaxID=1126241 RepID=A0ABD6C9D7_9EURY|nr:hypothetical protein [Halorientalis brevis]
MSDDEQWRYSVDEFPDDGPGTAERRGNGEGDVTGTDDDAPEQESSGNVAGQIGGLDDELEPGSPTMENAVFVVLGATTTVVFFMVVAGLI